MAGGGARAVISKIWRLGMLETTDRTLNVANFDALRQALRELGYIEGQNLKIEYRTADGRPERFPELTAELLRLQVDLILTRGTPATLAARNASGAIPVVMLSTADPFAIVASIARPGGNVTGLSSLLGELVSKRYGLLKEIVPGLTRIGVLTDPDNPTFARTRKTIEAATHSLGIQFLLLEVRTPQDIRPAFATASNQRIDAIGVGTETVTQASRKLIADLAVEHRLPAIYGSREFVDVGGPDCVRCELPRPLSPCGSVRG